MPIITFMRTRIKSGKVPLIGIAFTTKCVHPSFLDVSEQLKPENSEVSKELINKFQNNSLEPMLFERLDSIRLCQSKYLASSFIDFVTFKW